MTSGYQPDRANQTLSQESKSKDHVIIIFLLFINQLIYILLNFTESIQPYKINGKSCTVSQSGSLSIYLSLYTAIRPRGHSRQSIKMV